jgi:hypothetical protein
MAAASGSRILVKMMWPGPTKVCSRSSVCACGRARRRRNPAAPAALLVFVVDLAQRDQRQRVRPQQDAAQRHQRAGLDMTARRIAQPCALGEGLERPPRGRIAARHDPREAAQLGPVSRARPADGRGARRCAACPRRARAPPAPAPSPPAQGADDQIAGAEAQLPAPASRRRRRRSRSAPRDSRAAAVHHRLGQQRVRDRGSAPITSRPSKSPARSRNSACAVASSFSARLARAAMICPAGSAPGCAVPPRTGRC